MHVELVAYTQLAMGTEYGIGASGRILQACRLSPEENSQIREMDLICEFSGRYCRGTEQALGGDEDWLDKIIGAGHESILEHVSFTFLIEGISRACSHQLVRHRLASFSQRSQRLSRSRAEATQLDVVVPPTMRDTTECASFFMATARQANNVYWDLIEGGIPPEDARYVLPQAVTTGMVLTMNARELRHMFSIRISKQAQWEIRDICIEMLRLCHNQAPKLFADILEDKPGFIDSDGRPL